MSIPRFLLFFILASAASIFAEWRVALPGWNYRFPEDHGTHPDFKTEWWYFTGNLKISKSSHAARSAKRVLRMAPGWHGSTTGLANALVFMTSTFARRTERFPST